MKYILNETPIKTTNNFKVNNVTVDLNIPTEYIFHDYILENIDDIESIIKTNFKSNIGLEHDKYKHTKLSINQDNNRLIKLSYEFNNNDNLIDNIDIDIDNNSKNNIFINCYSNNDDSHFHNGNININIKDNAYLNLTILNNLNVNSINLLSSVINTGNNSIVKINLIDLSGKVRIYNIKSNTNKNSYSYLNNIYIGKNNDLIDLNYNYINLEELSNNYIEVQGILDDNATKTFKGIIDFKENSKKSNGHENENCLLLSKTCISKSLPILLCHEEDVDGTHSVSSGKIDSNKLFYLMSRGLTEEESKKLIIKANFNNIINEIPDEIKENISTIIDEII